ncbi:MAG TPA: hypothetical protein VFV33_07230, partial [Gemmatimonadaceae bacterium]|nr:hypothetical protein [Gemmatimonadaceae bacterium]
MPRRSWSLALAWRVITASLSIACSRHAPNRALPAADAGALLRNPAHPEWTRPAPEVSHLRFETTKG